MSMRNNPTAMTTEIHNISGTVPHESQGTWRQFLDSCEVRDTHEGTTFYGSVNCNYILLPNNIVLENFGFNGRNLMNKIREEGWEAVFDQRQKCYDEMQALLAS